MPYIKQEHKDALEKDLHFLAKRIRDVAGWYSEKLEGCLPVYMYACSRLAIEVLPQRRYMFISTMRAVFSDSNYEWCRRMKIRPAKVGFLDRSYPTLNKRIKKLATKISNIATKSKETYLVWPGLMNYSITALGLKIIDDPKDKRFAALVAGTLKYLHSSYYETIIAPYKDEQIVQNGDVFPKKEGT